MDRNFTLTLVDNEARDEDGESGCSPFTTRRAVRDLVTGLLPGNPSMFSDEDVLSEIGMTSLGMIGLLLALETRFDIEVPRAEITSEVFHSVSTVNALVGRLLARVSTSAGYTLVSAGPQAPNAAHHAAG